jgi:VIT1/CCC1 family predicted Fe2+/Mn2+ transporter/rubrerythrin
LKIRISAVMNKQKKFIKNLRQAWRDEMASARNYHALAGQEKNPERQAILIRMAEAEDRHARRWAERLKELGVETGTFKETPVEMLRRRMLLKSSPEAAAQMLEVGESQADKLYEVMILGSETEADRIALLEAQREENAHSLMLQEMTGPRVTHHPQSRLERILGKEKWHVTGGGWIGQAIYGVNDGLGAAFGVVSGVAGATNANSEFVLLSGLAAAIASALSMGSGAYLATKSEREVYEAELEREKREIEEHPEEEQEEMELFYQLKGFSPEESKRMSAKLAEQPEQLLKSLAHEELGLSEKTFPNQWKSAFSATISTAIGAIIPVIPFIFWSGMEALIISFVISTAAHFAVGSSKVILTGRSWIKSGTEMTLVGLGEALITYAIGLLIAPMIG